MMKACILSIWALLFTPCFSATKYIDYVGGSDSNNGASTATPWKHHPYMDGWSGSYSHAPGDRFIFKGGVTWPSGALPLTTEAGGSPGAGNDYYGVDASWYAGSSWSRPVFDGEYLESTLINIVNNSYITIDNLELKRVSDSSNYGYGLIAGGAPSHLLIDNCYLHGWRTTALTDDAHGGVMFGTASADIDTVVIDRSEIENSENGGIQWNGVCVRMVGSIRRSIIHDNSSAVLFCLDFDRSQLYNIATPFTSFDPTYHLNGIYLDPSTLGKSVGYIRNSYLHDVGGGANMAYPNPRAAATVYVYNNVMYGTMSDQFAVSIDPFQYASEGQGSCYVINNTIVNYASGAPAIHVVDRSGAGQLLGTLVAVNNHVIGISASLSDASVGVTVTTYIHSNSVIQTPGVATAQGYVLGNLYAPTLVSNATVRTGSSSYNGLFSSDILGNSRNPTWDIGAYQLPLPTAGVGGKAAISGKASLQ